MRHDDDAEMSDGKADEFEDSFEGEADWNDESKGGRAATGQDEEEAEIGSPAVSFAGGFGAPPPVSAFPSPTTDVGSR